MAPRRSAPPGPADLATVDAGGADDGHRGRRRCRHRAAHDLTVGQRISIIFTSGSREFTISGIFRIGDTDSLLGATPAAFDVHTAQELMDRSGEFDSISVVADDGVSDGAARRGLPRAAARLRGHHRAPPPRRRRRTRWARGSGSCGLLLVFALVSLFVGAFIIFNTFNIIVTQRVRELACCGRSARAAGRS